MQICVCVTTHRKLIGKGLFLVCFIWAPCFRHYVLDKFDIPEIYAINSENHALEFIFEKCMQYLRGELLLFCQSKRRDRPCLAWKPYQILHLQLSYQGSKAERGISELVLATPTYHPAAKYWVDAMHSITTHSVPLQLHVIDILLKPKTSMMIRNDQSLQT